VISEFFAVFKVGSVACFAHRDMFGLGHRLRKSSTERAEFFVFTAGHDEGRNID